MSMVDGLFEQLALRGLAVQYRDETTLVLRGPAVERTPEVMAAVKAFKPDLMARLRPRDGSAVHDHGGRPVDTNGGPEPCTECKAWTHAENGRADIGLLCDRARCPFKRPMW